LETTFQLDEGPIGRRLNRYDELGRLVRTLSTDGDGLELDFEAYSYNEDGRKTKLQFVPRLENPGACGVTYAVEGAQLAYGAEGVATITKQLFSPHKAMWSTTYGYDERGRQITRSTVMAGMRDERMTREYDEYDNPIREIAERTSGELVADESENLQSANPKSFRHEVRYEYKYDSHGNWTERVVSVRYETNSDFQRSNVERREIIYYSS
jgi:hypothetical protein